MGCFSALMRNEQWSHEKTWTKLKCILLSRRKQSEKATYIAIFWKRQDDGDSKNYCACTDWGLRDVGTRWIGRAQRILRAVTILCDIIMTDTCHYTLSEHRECTTSKVNPNVNYTLWVMMMCQRRFILGKLWVTLITGRAVNVLGQEAPEQSLSLPLKFVVNLKLLLRKS